MDTPAAKIGELWDLTNCDREPIHIPGSIQPHGCLLAMDADLKVAVASENAGELLGLDLSTILYESILNLFAENHAINEKALGEFERLVEISPFIIQSKKGSVKYHVYAFRSGGYRVLELERANEAENASAFYHSSRAAVSSMRDSSSLHELYNAAVIEIRKITRFDRVTIYRFDEAWNGHVLAEAKSEKADSYLDLHFPASDIPRQARELYRLNKIRIIPDVNYKVIPLVGVPNAAALDLSRSALRSVSPIHIEYLRNMPATASMSISLMVNGALWGLVSCTHLSGPLPLTFETRAICELIGDFVSALLPLRDADEARARAVQSLQKQSDLLAAMSQDDHFALGLTQDAQAFLKTVDAEGGAVFTDGDFRIVGRAPEREALTAIVRWLDEQPKAEIYSTDSLPEALGPIPNLQQTACGLLAFPVSSAQSSYVMWFRPEVTQTVTWGGDPRKPVTIQQGQQVLHPRTSFEAWKEVVRNRSLPWTKENLEAALILRKGILDVVLNKLERISLLNRELERSNNELDSFAYAASHDLKEPLRGITNYTTLLTRSLKSHLTTEDSQKLSTIARLTQRMEALINSLLDYSQVGRAEMSVRPTDMNDVVRAALDSLRARIEENDVQISVQVNLSTVTCDRVQATEVFTNLISNAIKYNDQTAKKIQIGESLESSDLVFHVRDNGIGIANDNQKSIFQIFKRLHGKDKYGGGTGTGLTIAQKIIERHNGRIWLESEIGEGTTFYFSFGRHA